MSRIGSYVQRWRRWVRAGLGGKHVAAPALKCMITRRDANSLLLRGLAACNKSIVVPDPNYCEGIELRGLGRMVIHANIIHRYAGEGFNAGLEIVRQASVVLTLRLGGGRGPLLHLEFFLRALELCGLAEHPADLLSLGDHGGAAMDGVGQSALGDGFGTVVGEGDEGGRG